MTVKERVAATGRLLKFAALARSALSGMAAALLLMALAWPFATDRRPVLALGFIAAVLVAWRSFARIRGNGFTLRAVSLWIEERIPSLEYALVTAVEGNAPAALDQSLSRADWSAAGRDATRKAVLLPALMVLAGALLLFASVSFAPSIVRVAGRATPGSRPSVPGILDVTLDVVPPPYARRRTESFRNPPVIRALAGSEVRVLVAGTEAVQLKVDTTDLPGARSWRVTTRPVALRVMTGSASRIIAIDPVTDSAPIVQIRAPARDTVLAAPEGSFALAADLRDDLGLSRAAFEYIVSSGSGESFTFASGSIGARQLGGTTAGSISGQLGVASLNLKPGDFVHVRAVAWDQRPDTSAARGTSETRTIRIARAGEYDSVSVEAAAPPDEDKAVLSQRMLINMAEALVRRRTRLARPAFGDESRSIARDQARLRKQVGDIVFSRLGDDPSGEHFHGDGHQHEGQELRPALTPDELLKAAENAAASAVGKVLDFEGDETPVVAVNRPLLEAYNFMWEAGRELEQAAPSRALPAMYRALNAIQRARTAERLYLRSRPPRAVVDIDRVRLQGKDKGAPAAREPRTSLGSSPESGVTHTALARFARLVRLSATDALAAADSLLLLRIDLLGVIPPAGASAAAAAADDLRSGRDATPRLAEVRRALGSALTADSLSRWSGAR